jgi:hypothetical protein
MRRRHEADAFLLERFPTALPRGKFPFQTNVLFTLVPHHEMFFLATKSSLRDWYGRPHTIRYDMKKCNCHSCYWPIFLWPNCQRSFVSWNVGKLCYNRAHQQKDYGTSIASTTWCSTSLQTDCAWIPQRSIPGLVVVLHYPLHQSSLNPKISTPDTCPWGY